MFPYERIKQMMDAKGITNADIARSTNKSTAAVSKWVTGQNVPKGESMMIIADMLSVSSGWLLTGEESTLIDSSRMMPVTFWDSKTPLDDDEFEVPFFKDFLVACGSGNLGEALRSETRKLRMSKLTARHLGVEQPMTAAMTAYGNSMSPKIDDGDTVFIDTSKTKIKDGKIFGICHGGVYRFKYLYVLPFNGIRIVSANADEYPEERLTAQEIQNQDFHVIGQVWSISSLESL